MLGLKMHVFKTTVGLCQSLYAVCFFLADGIVFPLFSFILMSPVYMNISLLRPEGVFIITN